MCGIAGFIGFENNVELADLANKIQQHRGPDHQETWSDDYIALAHQRLSIIDLTDAANQPFIKREFLLIFNGEIYNFQELREKLQQEKQVEFRTSSDTEVVLEAYAHYGIKCLDLFVGMFAFAIYNTEDRSLFIARDHFGIKPLFYTQIGDAFAFASELKTLVKVPGFNKTINPRALVSSLNFYFVRGNDSMFEGCHKLPPAHYMVILPGQEPKIAQYYDLEDGQTYQTTDQETKIVDDVEQTMLSSIERHMVADVPVSSFLSGGLDSSLISVMARKTVDSLSTYTIGTSAQDKKIEKMPEDEKYAARVAKEYDFDHHEIVISPDIIKDLPAIVRTLDEPIGDAAAINTYMICKAAREKGVKVVLSGMGADEIFFGYRRQKATLFALRFNQLPYIIKWPIAQIVNLLPVRLFGRGFRFGRWARRFMSFAMLPLDQAYMRSYSLYDGIELEQLLTPKYKHAVKEIQEEHKLIFDDKFKYDTINRICNTDINIFMLDLNLTYTDRASMAASVEVRVPFIDKLVIDHAMKIPGKFKYKDRESKYILKRAAERHLPHDIIYRPKAGFGAPIRSWISNDLREMVDELLSKEVVEKRGIYNYEFVKQLIDNDRKGTEDNAYQIYQMLTVELWFREFIDN